jgi:hypothetical protein
LNVCERALVGLAIYARFWTLCVPGVVGDMGSILRDGNIVLGEWDVPISLCGELVSN